jgi:molybdenum cofactor biosynthesis enzyme MoaA
MEIQSLSICVPAGCPNNCKFCVSKTHKNSYPLRDFIKFPEFEKDFISRLEYARDVGIQCVVLTGVGEPLTNIKFLESFGDINQLKLSRPFRHIEIQTSGVTLNKEKLDVLKLINISTISLSISAISSTKNAEYNGTPSNLAFNIYDVCRKIKDAGFNLRLSLNLTDAFSSMSLDELFENLSFLLADQVTFRVLYQSKNNTQQDKWISEHRLNSSFTQQISSYAQQKGSALYRLSFGAMRYDINGISVTVDEDCMNVSVHDSLKYLILREDLRLYSHWNKKGSLIF